VTARGTALEIKTIFGLFPELLGVGGVQEAGRLTAAALHEIGRSRGWTTDFLSLNDPPGQHLLDVGGHNISFRGFRRAKVRFAVAGIRRARSLPSGVNNVVLAAHPNLALPASWMRWSCPNLKTIVMSHGIEVWRPLPPFRRLALAGADILLAPSSDTAKKLVNVQGVPTAKVRKLAWPINPAFLRMAGAPAKLPLPATFPRGRVILTVGRWSAAERYKGADELIRGVAQLRTEIPGLHLVAVGGGDDLPRLRRLAADIGVADCVHFLENLSREEIAACCSHAEIFALPSTGEGFGLVFLEAMAFSKPVIGASCGGTTDVVEDEVNGLLVAPGDFRQLVQALSRLLRDDSLRERLGRRGAEIVSEKYGFDVFRSELEGILGD
jgi:phosphatidyl-myo-inositol dimannoside synthase